MELYVHNRESDVPQFMGLNMCKDGLWGVRVDSAYLGEQLRIVFKTKPCFLVLTFFFYRCAKKFPFCMLMRQPFMQMFQGYWQPSGIFFTGCWRELATLWQIYYWVSEGVAALWQMPQRMLVTFVNITYLSEGCQYSLIIFHRVLINLWISWHRVLDNH